MMVSERQASYMPTIKCSNCALDVALSATTEHVCSHTSTAVRQSPEVLPYNGTEYTYGQFGREPSLLKAKRPMQLPKIDPYAGNRVVPYSGELTPASSGHGSQVVSPKSSTSSFHRMPWPMPPPRKPSVPTVRGPPSPELVSQDCAFPPFPNMQKTRSNTSTETTTTDVDPLRKPAYVKSNLSSPRGSVHATASKPNSRRPSTSSSRSRSRSRTVGAKDEPSPKMPTSANSLKRRPSLSNLFGLRKPSNEVVPPLPTPSQSLSRKGSGDNVPVTPLSRTVSQPQPQPEPFKAFKFDTAKAPKSSVAEAFESAQELSNRPDYYEGSGPGQPSEVWPLAETEERNTVAPLPPARRLTLGRLDGPGDIPMREPSYRSKRPPPIVSDRPTESQEPSRPSPVRSPTYPFQTRDHMTGSGPNGIMGRRPSDSASTLRSVGTLAAELNSSSTVQSQQQSWPFSPYTDPSPAMTSAIFPPNSIAHLKSPRPDVVSKSHIEEEPKPQIPTAATNSMQGAFNEMASRPSRISVDSASSYGSEESLPLSMSSQSSPPRDEVRQGGTALKRDQEFQNAYSSDLPQPLRPHLPRMQTDSPTDPLFQNGLLSSIPPSPSNDALASHLDFPASKMCLSGDETRKDLPSRPAPPIRSKTTGSNKGTCRGCSNIIAATQKSVFSADGRLTGRFHKECFVCQTCRNPFSTADFYVFKDQPYCSHHYHEANGTLCTGCGKGIEGQYLETHANGTRASRKFHSSCLTCTTCRCQLRDDYFEFNGRVYCERDAFRMASLPGRSQYDSAPSIPSPLGQGMIMGEGGGDQGGTKEGRFPERRTTKLMNMI